MNYKYPPIYKYIILLILITSFLRYYKLITKENFLLIAGIFTYMSFIFDYVLINNHPSLLNDNQNEEDDKINKKTIYIKKQKNNKKNIKLIKNTENEINKLDEILDEESINFNNDYIEEFNNYDSDTENLTEEIQKELDELNN